MVENSIGISVGREIPLDGEWQLEGFGEKPLPVMPATVPGNIELALEANGVVPELFFGANERKVRQFEFYDWEYKRRFQVPEDFPAAADLFFGGIDCVAEIFLNGVKLAEVDNAFISHRIAVDEVLRRGCENTLCICIKAPILAAAKYELEHCQRTLWRNSEALPLRKPAHSYGWDIAPRFCLGGIWRGVSLQERHENRMLSCYFDVAQEVDDRQAGVQFSYSFATSLRHWDEFLLEIEMTCGDSVCRKSFRQYFTGGNISFVVDKPKLWWPVGYGEQNLYDAVVRISCDGQLLLEEHRRLGLRSVRFEYCDEPGKEQARFLVNGVPIMVKGSNWVPADALHSQDPKRDTRILELVSELGCNMLRVWGGGVYERQAFYDYCDEHGILVWQDFMMACATVPQTENFCERFRIEAEWAVKELRQHPCLVLWAGDNECDCACRWGGVIRGKPSGNRITREIIPQVLHRLDPGRPYLPSSPYISKLLEEGKAKFEDMPEQHLWGPRDYFKSPFYADHKAVFISEMGYHGMPNVESMRKFLPQEKLWPVKRNMSWLYDVEFLKASREDFERELVAENQEWCVHATLGYEYRIPLMFQQVKELFLTEPRTLEDFVLASQISQAEADKFFIENVRRSKWEKTGLIWWNVMDCWPQFSDAVVDYYFSRKLAFDYIRRSQVPVLGMVGEWHDWGHDVIMANDTMRPVKGTVLVSDAESCRQVFAADFSCGANENCLAGSFRWYNGDRRLLKIVWNLEDGPTGSNHYVTGHTPLDFEVYKNSWLPLIKAL